MMTMKKIDIAEDRSGTPRLTSVTANCVPATVADAALKSRAAENRGAQRMGSVPSHVRAASCMNAKARRIFASASISSSIEPPCSVVST